MMEKVVILTEEERRFILLLIEKVKFRKLEVEVTIMEGLQNKLR